MSGSKLQHPGQPTDGKPKKDGGIKSEPAAEGLAELPGERTLVTRIGDQVIADKLKKHGYTFIEELGEGGMGKIYHATEDRSDNRDVAIKVMSRALFNDDSARERFLQEAKAIGKIQHPNVVVVYYRIHDREDKEIYIVMEYLKGRNMFDVLTQDGPLDWNRARRLFSQVCDGLSAAHEEDVVHRDIKPENIYVINNNGHGEHVKLLDFGLAKIANATRQFKTIDGAVMGSPEYMAPEQAKGERHIDNRTDIYAVGAVMYHMIAGVPPFESNPDKGLNEAWMEIGLKIISETPMPPKDRVPGRKISDDVSDIIMKCLEKDPKDRFQTMEELKGAIMAASGYGKKPADHLQPFSLPGAAGPVDLAPTGADPALEDTDVAPAKIPEEHLPSVMIRESQLGALPPDLSSMPTTPRLTPVGEGNTAIVRVESIQPERKQQRHEQTMLVHRDAIAGMRAKKNKRLFAGVVAGSIIAAGAIGIVTYVATRPKPQPPLKNEDPVAETQPLIPVTVPDAPVQSPDAEVVAPPRTFQITIRTGIDGVEVIRDSETLCTTASGQCVVSLAEGSDSVELTLHKSGYREAQVSIVPDADRTIPFTLERERVRPVIRNPPPPRGSQSGNGQQGSQQPPGLIRMEPSIPQKK
ncbi:MAG: serine/threonine-protein kinase [Candidatus Micrarchaeia archaeon]